MQHLQLALPRLLRGPSQYLQGLQHQGHSQQQQQQQEGQQRV
jgi:hypothetical protein